MIRNGLDSFVEIFAEGLLRFLCKKGLGDVSLTSKYHNSYPDGGYVERMDNAGEIGGDYITRHDIDHSEFSKCIQCQMVALRDFWFFT